MPYGNEFRRVNIVMKAFEDVGKISRVTLNALLAALRAGGRERKSKLARKQRLIINLYRSRIAVPIHLVRRAMGSSHAWSLDHSSFRYKVCTSLSGGDMIM
jgi:hypothetical protein